MASCETAPSACDLMVEADLIVTLDAEDRIIAEGAVAVSADRILDVGTRDDISARFEPACRLSGIDRILLPGLVNVHNHTPLMITRGMIEDLAFAPAYTPSIPQGHALSFEETLALARLGAYELLRTGSTTVVDYYRYPRALAQAAEELGLRAVICGRIHDADPAALAEGRWEHRPEIGDSTLRETWDLIEAFDGRGCGRIRCEFAPHAPDTCSAALLRRIGVEAARHDSRVHTHLAQSRAEVEYVRGRDGTGPVQVLADAGLLDQRLIAAHCIFLEPEDITQIGRAECTVAHSPIGNARAGDAAPILDLEAAGARVALCTDTMSADMFEAMRMAISVARMREGGFEPKARKVLRWATVHGARALGRDEDIGSIEAGKKADLVMLDRHYPNLNPVIDGYGILVHSAQGLNVDTVVIDGQVRLRDGRSQGFDGEAVVHDAQAVAERLWRRYGHQPVTSRADLSP